MPRPASVTVFGILNIVFGGLGLCVIPFSAVVLNTPPGPDNPMGEIMRDNPTYRGIVVATLVLGVPASVAALAAGIAMLNARPWGRMVSIIYGWVSLVVGIVGLIVNVTVVLPALLAEAQKAQGPAAAGAIGGAVGGTVGGAAGLVYPVLLLVFMYRPNVVAYFQGVTADQSQPAPLPWQTPQG